MKNLFLVAMVGVFSLVSVFEAQAGRCHRGRRCGGGCNSGGCYTTGYSGGCYAGGGYGGACQTGGYSQGHMHGAYADPSMAGGAAVQPGNVVPAAPTAPAAP